MERSHIDVIISWPKSMDYPLWRDFIVNHLEHFNQIFIVFTETHAGIDYSHFIQDSLKGHSQFTFIYPEDPRGSEDWRNKAVNAALDESTATWVWFTEQDLFVTSPSFWLILASRMRQYDVIGYKEGNRMHPANMLVKREFINKTKRDFGIVPDELDHFGRFYFQLRHTGANIHTLKYDPNGDSNTFYHMNGLSHNLSLIQRGEPPVYKLKEFDDYVRMTLTITDLDPRYKEMCEKYLETVSDANTN